MPPRELIEKVLEAGRFAPTASNRQTIRFIVITKPEVLDTLARLVREETARLEGRDPASAANDSKAFHYHAPALIVTTNKIGYANALTDSSCALENMMVAANALDLGSCWVNQIRKFTDAEAVRAYMYTLGMPEDEAVTGSLALGYAADGLPNREPLPRTGNPFSWITDED